MLHLFIWHRVGPEKYKFWLQMGNSIDCENTFQGGFGETWIDKKVGQVQNSLWKGQAHRDITVDTEAKMIERLDIKRSCEAERGKQWLNTGERGTW